jgi:hypothetical protein
MQMNIDGFDLIAPPCLTAIVLTIGYLWSRTVRREQPLSSPQKKMMAYAGIFTLGMTYIIMLHEPLGDALHWPSAWIPLLVGWGVILALFAWYRHRRNTVPHEIGASKGDHV